LLQVCSQVLGNALHALEENGGKRLTICTSHHHDVAVLQVSAEGTGRSQSRPASNGAQEENESMMGMSACQGIVQEHRGRIWLEHDKQGGITANVELPVATSVLQSAMRTAPLPA